VLWPALAGLTVISLIATLSIRPDLLDNYKAFAPGWMLPVLVAASLAGMLYYRRAGEDRNAFLSSCAYLVGMLGGAAFALYPALLPSTSDPGNSITIHNAAAGANSLSVGLVWWSIGMLIAVGYFVFVYRMFSGKVHAGGGEHGY
jgi:cytochrome bd ubiquinol oxidase subunit II